MNQGDVLEKEEVVTTDDGDHDRFSHYVDKNKATESYVEGTPITALCGKVWIPTRNPDNYPVCPRCAEILEAITNARSN